MSKNRDSLSPKGRWLMVGNGIVFTFFGLLSLVNTWTALESAAIYIGIVSIAAGLMSLFYSFANFSVYGWVMAMIEGVVDIIFGIFILSYPIFSADAIPMILGLWIMFRGILWIITSFGDSPNSKSVNSNISRLAVGCLAMLLGLYLIVEWEVYFISLPVIISIMFLGVGLWSLVRGMNMYADADEGF